MSGTDITIQGADGEFGAYLATPSAGSGPGVVVAQEIFGVNKVMRDVCDQLADAGYVALSPDLFWRQEPGIQITDQTDAEWARAFELYQGFDLEAGMGDLQASISTLRGMDACTGRVGAVGYCLGGLLAYLMGTRTDVDGAVGFYGVGIEGKLDEAANLQKPGMLHVATEDQFCSKEAQAKIHAGLDGNPLITIHDYQGNDHAFARPGGAHYDAAAASLANSRTLDFFSANLA
jgi:carboxymethylenebutenolidase